MTLINKRHPEIINKLTSGGRYIYVSVDFKTRRMHFTKHACLEYGLQAGKYLHFMNEGKEWFFIQNDDKDGFELKSRKSGSLDIYDAGLLFMFKRSTGLKLATKLFVARADRKIKTDVGVTPVFEIFTNKTYNELIKAS